VARVLRMLCQRRVEVDPLAVIPFHLLFQYLDGLRKTARLRGLRVA